MAQKKTQSKAQKAAASKTSAPRAAGKSSPEKEPVRIPVRLITSLVCLVLFVLFLTMALVDEGWLILLLRGVVLGLIGKVSFYVAIPGLAYLFVIQAFSGRRPIVMRSVCMISFILLCGCFSQLFCDASGYQTGTGVVSSLYQGGVDGSSAGFLCGGLALLLSRTISVPLTGVALVVAAAFTLLGAFQITIPSIIRAVQNRPRADWEEEPREPDPEPAAVVVNTIANKRIEYVENKRRRQEEKEIDIPVDDEPAAKPERSPKRKLSPRARQLMEQIDDAPLEEPVAAAQTPVAPEPEEEDGPLFAPPPDPVRIAPEAEPEIPNFSFAPAPEPPKEATPAPPPVPVSYKQQTQTTLCSV
ncbi:MAG: hypothetical protein LUH51_08450 [Firmicutes bacterium]|nr:hypothetical protein [Bacillota bacterium]